MSNAETLTPTKPQIAIPVMWKVVLINDDFTPMRFVVELLIALFRKPRSEAERIANAVHTTGRGLVGLFTKEIALTRVAQCKQLAEQYGHPLLALAEPT